MIRTVLLLTTALFALLAAPSGIAPSDPCVDAGSASACGSAEAFICSGSASGEATGIVTWKFVLDWTNPYGSKTKTSTGPAAVFAETTDACSTGTCTRATLYANNVLVDQSLWVC
jgi:hypothetical protein